MSIINSLKEKWDKLNKKGKIIVAIVAIVIVYALVNYA